MNARREGWLVLTVAAVLWLAAGAVAQPADGLYVSVPNPLTSEAYTRIRNRVEEARGKADHRPTVLVFDFNPQDKDAGTPLFGPCQDLGAYIAKLTDVTTVAYVHRRVTGHTVFPVVACQQLVVGPGGVLGPVVGKGEARLDKYQEGLYTSVAAADRPAYHAVVRKLFDPGVQLRKGKKGDAAYFVDLRDQAEFEKAGVKLTDTSPLSAAPDGGTASYTAAQLRELGLSRLTVDTRQDLLEAFNLSPAAVKEDPFAGRPPVAYRYTLRGPVDAGTREAVGRLLKDITRHKGNLLFLELRCRGGDLIAAAGLAEDLRKAQEATGDDAIQVVAYIPEKAPDTAAVVALGCSAIVMSKTAGATGGAEAEFGDFEGVLRGPDAGALSATWAPTLRELAEAGGYPPLLAEGLVRKDLAIVQVQKKGNRSVRRLMTEDELAANKADWELVSQVKAKGQLLKLTATQAEQLGLARFVVDKPDDGQVYAKFGVAQGQVREATPAWLDRFANFLTNPAVTIILVVIGFTGLILELKVPGTTVPGIIAALCFILVFWAHTQFSGQVAVLAGLLFLLGLVLVLLEVFVLPGFGAAGVTGILVILLALGLATFGSADGGIPQTAAEWTRLGGKMGQYLFAMIGAVALAFLLARFLPNIPSANRLMLTPPAEKPDADEPELPGAAEAASLLGAVGTAVTVLRPAGTVRFGDAFVDVVTDGGFIPAGARVQAIEVEGTRIVVKEV